MKLCHSNDHLEGSLQKAYQNITWIKDHITVVNRICSSYKLPHFVPYVFSDECLPFIMCKQLVLPKLLHKCTYFLTYYTNLPPF